jgi:type I restriction enzyme S subunit
MALCDRLETQQQERGARRAAIARASLARFADAPTPANLQFLFHPYYTISPTDLRKCILTLAVQGKLVPQDPSEPEPKGRLIELYESKLSLAHAGKLKVSKVPSNAWLHESRLSVPKSWRTVCFDHLAAPDNNALKAGPFGSALKKEFYVANGYKIYGQEQVIGGDPFYGDYYIDENKFAELESCSVAPGDILVSLVGTIGKVLVLPDGVEPGIINPRLIKLSLEPSLAYPHFIKILLGSPYAEEFFDEKSHGGTMSILNLSILRELPIPLPPLAEQRRIVAKVDQLTASVDQLEVQLTASKATATKLMEAVVAELTMQD